MYKYLLTILVIPCFYNAQSKEYLVFFKDKKLITEKELILTFSERAIENKKNIGFDYYDLPINPSYNNNMNKKGAIINQSKWLNAIHFQSDYSKEELLNSYNFIRDIIVLNPNENKEYSNTTTISNENSLSDTSLYQHSYDQLELTSTISCMHDKGYDGTGVLIAVLDAGFPQMDSMKAFSKMRNEGRIIDTWDFEDNAQYVYHKSTHGTYVSSILGAQLDSTYIGSAPQASYAFYITEITRFERNIEEFNLILGLERADSIGADICSISLGYRNFDTLQVSYGYAGMDGKTTIAAQGVKIARNKGIIISVAAGNNGSGTGTLSSPCDTDSVICVGAVGIDSIRAGFSSEGPSVDGRIKPEVVTVGFACAFVRLDDSVRRGSGTSFATPLMSGMVAGIKQAHPLRTNFQIIEAIKKNSHLANNPDNVYGWGIPNACKVDSALNYLDSAILALPEIKSQIKINVFPNPSTGIFNVNCESLIKSISVIQLDGKIIINKNMLNSSLNHTIDLSQFPVGIYMVQYKLLDGRIETRKVIKK